MSDHPLVEGLENEAELMLLGGLAKEETLEWEVAQYIKKLENLFYENMSGGASEEACELWDEIDARMPKPEPQKPSHDSAGYPIDENGVLILDPITSWACITHGTEGQGNTRCPFCESEKNTYTQGGNYEIDT